MIKCTIFKTRLFTFQLKSTDSMTEDECNVEFSITSYIDEPVNGVETTFLKLYFHSTLYDVIDDIKNNISSIEHSDDGVYNIQYNSKLLNIINFVIILDHKDKNIVSAYSKIDVEDGEPCWECIAMKPF